MVSYSLNRKDTRQWKDQMLTANDFFEYVGDSFDTPYDPLKERMAKVAGPPFLTVFSPG